VVQGGEKAVIGRRAAILEVFRRAQEDCLRLLDGAALAQEGYPPILLGRVRRPVQERAVKVLYLLGPVFRAVLDGRDHLGGGHALIQGAQPERLTGGIGRAVQQGLKKFGDVGGIVGVQEDARFQRLEAGAVGFLDAVGFQGGHGEPLSSVKAGRKAPCNPVCVVAHTPVGAAHGYGVDHGRACQDLPRCR
jgi:hypothetical protein